MAGIRITEWNGPEIARKIKRASVEAIDEVLEETDRDASASHWWQSDSGNLQEQIITEAAEEIPSGARGRFGTTRHRGFYGLILERRQPFLRPAADRNFPHLAAAIKKRLT